VGRRLDQGSVTAIFCYEIEYCAAYGNRRASGQAFVNEPDRNPLPELDTWLDYAVEQDAVHLYLFRD
jgi:hypothetical protein